MKPPLPRVLLLIPGLWAVIGTAAALSLGMREDLGLPAAALITVGITFARGRGSASGDVHLTRPLTPNAV